MPKRKRDKDSDYEHLARKVKKLTRKMKRARRISTSSSESNTQSLHNSPESKSIATDENIYEENGVYSPGRSSWYDFSESVHDLPTNNAEHSVTLADIHQPPADVNPRPRSAIAAPPQAAGAGATTSGSAAATPQVTTAASLHTAPLEGADADTLTSTVEAGSSAQQPNDIQLDSDLLAILGEDPTRTKEYGPDIQKDLAIRLNHIVTSGLSKENRKEIKEKYVIPANCKLLKAPSLNPEIRASLVETQAKRDKGIENKQNMTSCALSSLASAITMLLSSENKNPELLKPLMDTARILGDIQHSDSILRRFFILSTVKKDMRDQLEKTEIGEMLFGSNLSETLKSAKTISKSGADLRSATTAKPAQTTTKPPGRPLNYRPPPATRRPAAAGAGRGARFPPPPPPWPAPTPRQTTMRPPQHGASRTSSRQPPARHRRY